MRASEKILIFLFAATVGLATFIVFPSSDTDEALRDFRALFSKNSLRTLPNTLRPIIPDTFPPIIDETSLYYGGISLLAIVMIVVTLRMARGGGKARGQEASTADDNVVAGGKWPSRAERSERKVTEAARQDSEAKARRIYALEGELSEKEKLLKSRDQELETLRSQLRVLTEREGEMMSVNTREEDALRDELERKTDLLKAKDSAMKDLERHYGRKIQSLEDQLWKKDEIVRSRNRELEELRSELNTVAKRLTGSGAADDPAEELIWSELFKPKSAVQQRDELGIGHGTESSHSSQAMGAMLAQKEELLKTRDKRIEKLETELKEKRTELARYEIVVRQAIERRDLWKRRLANFGITLKD
jgi:hypothetical protein